MLKVYVPPIQKENTMSVRYSRGRGSSGKKPHQRGNGRPRQTDEVVVSALSRRKPRQDTETSRTSAASNSKEFKEFIREAVASAPIDRRSRPLARNELVELYGADVSYIRRF